MPTPSECFWSHRAALDFAGEQLGEPLVLRRSWALSIVTRTEEATEAPPTTRRQCAPSAVAGARQVPARVSVGVKTMLCMGAISARTAASAAAA